MLSNVRIVSNNSRNTQLAKIGDVLRVQFSVSEALLVTPSVSIAGSTASSIVQVNSSSYEASLVLSDPVGQADGTTTIVISAVEDRAGNIADVVNSITVGSNVTFGKSCDVM